MTLVRSKLYSILLIACFIGYIWLYYSITYNTSDNKSLEVCFIKHLTDIPCPSCGSTRSIISITKGDFIAAIDINPLGYIVAIVMLIVPVWAVGDLIMRNDSLFIFYHKIENYLNQPIYAIPLILIVIINWIWNITKGI